MYECHLFRASETMTQLSSVCAHYERPKDSDAYDQTDSTPDGSMSPLITSVQFWQPNNIRRPKEKEKKGFG